MNNQHSEMPPSKTPLTFNPLDFIVDPFPTLHRLRQEDPVHKSPEGFWFLTRYDDVNAVLRNQKLFGAFFFGEQLRARLGDGAAFAYVSRRLSSYDPPEHTRLRSLLTKAFTARRVEAMRPHMQAIADRLLDVVTGMPQMDVIDALAHPLPSLVICEMLGVPEADRPQFSTWTGDIAFLSAAVITPERLRTGEAAAAAFMDY